MDKIIKLTNNPLFQTFFGDVGFRVYKQPISARLGMPGLSKLVAEATGQDMQVGEAYVFIVKKHNAVKVLAKNNRGTNMVEVWDEDATGIKDQFIALGLLK